MTNQTLRIGLLGVGGICAGVHYPGLRLIDEVAIAGICEPNDALREQRQQEWGIPQAYADSETFFHEVKPDAVIIATPNKFHRELILEALANGCHVLCEKPLGLNYAETVQVYEAAKAAGVVHMMAFTYRFVPGMNFLRHLVHSGELGEIRHARFQRLQDWGLFAIGWRQYKAMAGSGELGDMGIHRIDFAQDLLGPIVSVCGSVRQWEQRTQTSEGITVPPQDVEDWAAWLADFASGATGVFEMGKLTKGYGPDGGHDLAEINGTKASAVYRLHTPHEILFARVGRGETYQTIPVPEEFLKRPGSPRKLGEGDPVRTFRYDQAWEFISAMREGRDAVPSFYDGMAAQSVADAILQSAAERRWVDAPQAIK